MNPKGSIREVEGEIPGEKPISQGSNIPVLKRFFMDRANKALSMIDRLVVSKYRNVIPAMMFATSLSVTLCLMDIEKDISRINTVNKLESQLTNAIFPIQNGIGRFKLIGAAIDGLFKSSDAVTQEEFSKFIGSLHLSDKFPEVSKISVLHYEKESNGNHNPMIYLEPHDGNTDSHIKGEIFVSPAYNEDMGRALSFKESVISRVVPHNPGSSKLLIFHPIFGKNYGDNESVNLPDGIGWSAISFDLWALVSEVLPRLFSDTDLRIYDGTIEDNDTLIFSSFAKENTNSDAGLKVSKLVKVANKEWLFVVRTTREIEKDGDNQGYLVAITGILVSLILTGAIWYFVQKRNESLATIKKLKVALDKISEIATHDALTGFLNRTGFLDTLHHSLAHADRNKTSAALLYLDLDRFKIINDAYGHEVGDKILIEVAERIKRCLRDGDIVGRMGGDEFTVLLSDLRDPADAAKVAQKINDTLSQLFNIDENKLHTGASIGIATYPLDSLDPAELIKFADIAMYRVKARDRNGYEFFSEGMEEESRNRQLIESVLHLALEHDGFFVMYQPVVDIHTGEIVSMEALVRCQNPEFGGVVASISPGEFIPVAESTGLIVPMGRKVIRMVCEQVAQWKKDGINVPKVAINLSVLEIQSPGLIEYIEKILKETGLTPQELSLEITESMFIKNIEMAINTFNILSEMGFTIAIDDFGTGYSNFGRLMQFKISTLKIDRSFVLSMNTADGIMTMKATIAAAKGMKMRTIAEGVETREEFEKLREMGCDCIQGYYFSRPKVNNDITPMLVKKHIFDVRNRVDNFEV